MNADMFTMFCFSFALAMTVVGLMRKVGSAKWKGDAIAANDRAFRLVAAALFLLFAAVRLWRFGSVPGGMNQDGAMAAVDAYALSLYGTDRFGMWLPAHLTAWGYGQMSALMSYLTVPFVKLFGLSAFAARLPVLIASLVSGGVLFRFVWRLCGRSAAIVTLFFLAINPWHIMQSRWALDCNLLPHMLIIGMYCLYLGLGRRRWLYVAMVFFALAMYSYGIAWFTVPVLLAALCVYLLRKKLVAVWEALVAAGVFLVLSTPILTVMAVNVLDLPTVATPLFTAANFSDSVRAGDLIFFSDNFFGQLFENFKSFMTCVVFQDGDPLWNAIPGFGTIYLFSMPFVAAGFFAVRHLLKALDERRRAGLWFFVIWLFVGVFAGLAVNGANINRINLIFYPLIVLAALGIWFLLFIKTRKEVAAGLVAGMYLVSFGLFAFSYFGETNDALSAVFFDGFGEALEHADAIDPASPVTVTANTQYPGAYHVTDILVQFNLSIDARYMRGESGDPRGRTALPYAERYRIEQFSGITPKVAAAGEIFVYKAEERALFDAAGYVCTDYGGYGVAVAAAGE